MFDFSWDFSRPFTFHSPQILFGPGVVQRVGERARQFGGTHALVVAEQGVAEVGAAEKALASLRDAGIAISVFSDFRGEPTVEHVNAGVEFARQRDINIIVGCGGGSSLDCAKAINVLLTNGGSVTDYMYGRARPTKPTLPFIGVPTTAGTGAEISGGAIIYDVEGKFKEGVGSPPYRIAAAICDPELTLTVPPRVTAMNGMDALGHAIESYTNINFNPISDLSDLTAISLVGRYLPVAVARGDTLQARAALMFAAMIAAFGFAQRGTGICHGISHPLGVWGGLPHGLTISLMLPHVMEFNLNGCAEKLADVAQALGEDVSGVSMRTAALRAVEAVRRLSQDIGLPQTLREAGVREEVLPLIARDTLRRANNRINPRLATEDEILALLRKAY
jgi:alcohol dehydrogenase class IV